MITVTQTAILLAAAVIAVSLFRFVRLSSILGYLAAGLVIGPWGLNLIGDIRHITQVAEFGIDRRARGRGKDELHSHILTLSNMDTKAVPTSGGIRTEPRRALGGAWIWFKAGNFQEPSGTRSKKISKPDKHAPEHRGRRSLQENGNLGHLERRIESLRCGIGVSVPGLS